MPAPSLRHLWEMLQEEAGPEPIIIVIYGIDTSLEFNLRRGILLFSVPKHGLKFQHNRGTVYFTDSEPSLKFNTRGTRLLFTS
jgi:hypothetical protein